MRSSGNCFTASRAIRSLLPPMQGVKPKATLGKWSIHFVASPKDPRKQWRWIFQSWGTCWRKHQQKKKRSSFRRKGREKVVSDANLSHNVETVQFCLIIAAMAFVVAAVDDDGQIVPDCHFQLHFEDFPLSSLLFLVAESVFKKNGKWKYNEF